MLFNQFITLLVAYLLGSIPCGLLISKQLDLLDPRETGSKSTGATNILRSGNYLAAGLTLVGDILKGSAAIIFALFFEPSLAKWCAILAVAGHIWPVWLGFKGGKGIATALGVLFVFSGTVAFACIVSWITLALLFRYSSLASMITVILAPLFTLYLIGTEYLGTLLIIAALILWKHRYNMRRLILGKEPKIGQSSTEDQ